MASPAANYLSDDPELMNYYDDQEMMRLFPPQQVSAAPIVPVVPPAPPPPGVAPVAGLDQATANVPPVPNAPIPPTLGPDAGPGAGYQDALTRLENTYGSYPVRQQPKWWQRALGAAAGFGAGWSNAASRTKRPIDIGQLDENILYPGYSQKVSEFQSRELPLSAQAQIEGQKQAAWWKQRQEQANEDYREALGQQARDRGAYWLHRAQQEQLQWGPDPAVKGGLYNRITGQRVPPPSAAETPEDRYARGINKLHLTPAAAGYYATNGNLTGFHEPAPPKPEAGHSVAPGGAYVDSTGKLLYMNPNRPGRGGSRGGVGTDAQFRQVEKTKNDRLNKARDTARKALDALGPSPADEDVQRILNGLTDTEQLHQNEYENEVSALGGEPEHYVVPQETLEGFQRSGPRQTAAPAPQPRPRGNRKPLAQIFGK